MKNTIRLTESQLISLIKKTIKKVLKEDNDMLNSDSLKPEHNIEDLSDWDMEDDILTLYFGKADKREEYEIDWDAFVSGSYHPATLESPEEYPEIELIINSIKQVYPIEKKMAEKDFYVYLSKLGIYQKFMSFMNNLAEERVDNEADGGYEPDRDGPDDEWRG